MSRFLHPQYAGLEAYTPGEQPRDRQYIKLNTNESPVPPRPRPAGWRPWTGDEARSLAHCGCTPTRRAPPCGPNWQNSTGWSRGRSSSPTVGRYFKLHFHGLGADGAVFPP